MASTLNARQRKFVDGMLAGKAQSQAAREAGYSAKASEGQGSRLMRDAKVRAALAKAQQRTEARTGVTVAGVLARLQELSQCAQDAGQYGPAVKAEELLGKHKRMFQDRLEVEAGPTLAGLLAKVAADDEGEDD